VKIKRQKSNVAMLMERVGLPTIMVVVCNIAGDGRGKASGPEERLLHLRGLNDVSGVYGS
jgi:hypothetical protein